jgi:hypothetical protein
MVVYESCTKLLFKWNITITAVSFHRPEVRRDLLKLSRIVQSKKQEMDAIMLKSAIM